MLISKYLRVQKSSSRPYLDHVARNSINELVYRTCHDNSVTIRCVTWICMVQNPLIVLFAALVGYVKMCLGKALACPGCHIHSYIGITGTDIMKYWL